MPSPSVPTGTLHKTLNLMTASSSSALGYPPSPGSSQGLELFIKFISVLCSYLPDASFSQSIRRKRMKVWKVWPGGFSNSWKDRLFGIRNNLWNPFQDPPGEREWENERSGGSVPTEPSPLHSFARSHSRSEMSSKSCL